MLGAAATPLTDPETWSVPAPPPAALSPSGELLSSPVRAGRCFSLWIPKHSRGGGFPTVRRGRPPRERFSCP